MVSQLTVTTILGKDIDRNQFSIVPLDVQFEVTLGTKTFHFAVFPCIRQSRQKIYAVIMALQKHFRNTGSAAEIAVDLEGRMVVEEVVEEQPKTKLQVIREKLMEKLSAEMREAAARLEFEQAAYLRDKIKELREEE